MWRLTPTPQMNHRDAAKQNKEKDRGKTHWDVISKRCGISFVIWTVFANHCPAQFGTWMMNFHNTWKNSGPLEMVLLKLNTLWLPCVISLHNCMGGFQALGKRWEPGGDTRCLGVHRRSPQRWSVVLRVWHGYKGVWMLPLASWSVFIVRFAAAKCWGSDFVTACTLVVQSCSTSVSPRQGQEKEPESRSQSQTVRSPICFGISVVNAVLQNIWCACLHSIAGNIFRAFFLSSVWAAKVLHCIFCGALVLHISSVSLEISAQHLNVAGGCPSPLSVCTSTKGCRLWPIAKSDLPPQLLWG